MTRFLIAAVFALALLAPGMVRAQDKAMDKSMTDKAVEVVKDNPAKTAAVAACGAAIAFFPPALLICVGAGAGGYAIDEVAKQN